MAHVGPAPDLHRVAHAGRRGRAAAQFVLTVAAAFAVGAGLTLALSGGQALGHTVIAHMNPLLSVEHAVRVFLELPKQA